MRFKSVHGIYTNKTVKFCAIKKIRGAIYRNKLVPAEELIDNDRIESYIKSSKTINCEMSMRKCSHCKYRGCRCALVGDAECPKKRNKALCKQSNKKIY